MVELVSKLQERGLLGPDLLHTINGREYLTPERLRGEVVDAVAGAGGRIALVWSSHPAPPISQAGHCSWTQLNRLLVAAVRLQVISN